MNIPRYLSCLLFLLPAAVIAQSPSTTAQPVCWEPLSSAPLLKSACYFDAKKLGLGIQGMKLGHIETSQDDNQASCVYSSKGGGTLTSKTFQWLRFNKSLLPPRPTYPSTTVWKRSFPKYPIALEHFPKTAVKLP